MELLTPGVGLIFWQFVVFIALFILLAKFAWKPILQSLKIREESIQEALDSAAKAKEDMAQLKSDNDKLLAEARQERDKILKEAREIANNIKEEATEEASKTTSKMVEDAKAVIETEKQAALTEVKTQVAMLSLEIAEKLVRQNLSDDKSQKALVEDFIKDIKSN
ncbi:MAG: F0F1 ATP synthase subunit B [Bacteroidota bacterium]